MNAGTPVMQAVETGHSLSDLSKASRGFLYDIRVLDIGQLDSLCLFARFDPTRYDPALFAQLGVAEPKWLNRAVAKRQAEFLAGRLLARAAISCLGGPDGTISQSDRMPVWPIGWSGSISHCDTRCFCLVKHSETFLCGADVERCPTGETLEAIWSETLTNRDKWFLSRYPEPKRRHLTTAVFSAKETLFKALYPSVRAFFGFSAASLGSAPSGSLIRLRLNRDLNQSFPQNACFDIRLRLDHAHVLTWIAQPWQTAGVQTAC